MPRPGRRGFLLPVQFNGLIGVDCDGGEELVPVGVDLGGGGLAVVAREAGACGGEGGEGGAEGVFAEVTGFSGGNPLGGGGEALFQGADTVGEVGDVERSARAS